MGCATLLMMNVRLIWKTMTCNGSGVEVMVMEIDMVIVVVMVMVC